MNGKKEQQWEFFSAIPSPGNATKVFFQKSISKNKERKNEKENVRFNLS